MEYYITSPADYWIAPTAVNISLNALGNANRIQGSVVSGAVIMCFVESIRPASQGGEPENGDGLYYGANHEPKRWPLSLSPTYFNSNTHKYVYAAIPRSTSVGNQAVVVFPSEQLDIYGRALRLQDGDDEPTYEQIGSTDYFYVYLNGIISAVYTDAGVEKRRWEVAITDWGRLDTAQGRDDKQNQSEWYLYSQADKFVTFLKDIVMSADSSFRNLILNHKSLTDVATSAEETLVDSDTMVATPNYVQKFYLSKAIDDEAAGEIGFLKGLWIKAKGLFGFDADGNIIANTIKALSGLINSLQSANYKEGELTGTGYQLTNDNGEGLSKLEADIIVARTRFIVNELQVRKYVAMGGNYVFSPAASQIERVDYYDANGNLLGYDMLKVPLMARIGTALKNMLMRSGNTTKVLTIRKFMRTTDPIDMNQVAFFRCWIKADDGTTRTINTWQSGMLARCQTADIEEINGRNDGDTDHRTDHVNGKTSHGNVFYWRLVKAAGQGKFPDLADDDKVHSYVDLSNVSNEYASGSMAPAAGDDIVCFGATKRAYSNLTIIETTTSDAPAIKEYYGIGLQDNEHDNKANDTINWSLDGKEVTKISPKGDIFTADHFSIRVNGQDMSLNAYFDIQTDNIMFGVNGKLSNPNLFLGIDDGEGWQKSSISLIDNCISLSCSGISLIAPSLQLSAGNYTLSFVPNSDSANNITVTVKPKNGDPISDEVSKSEFGQAKVIPFTLSASDEVTISWETTNNVAFSVTKPKLETGLKATSWEQGAIGSQIKMTADSIVLNVKEGLNDVGIYILGEQNKIVAKAGTFEIQDANDHPTFIIDSDGNLQTDGDASFKGNITATGGTIGGFNITTTAISSNEQTPKIVLNGDGTATVGAFSITSTGTFVTGNLTVSGNNQRSIEILPSYSNNNVNWGAAIVGKKANVELFRLGFFNNAGDDVPWIYLTDSQTIPTEIKISNEQISHSIVDIDDGQYNILQGLVAQHENTNIYGVKYARGDGASTGGQIVFGMKSSIAYLSATNGSAGASAWPRCMLDVQGARWMDKGHVHVMTMGELKTLLENPDNSYYNHLSNYAVMLTRIFDN